MNGLIAAGCIAWCVVVVWNYWDIYKLRKEVKRLAGMSQRHEECVQAFEKWQKGVHQAFKESTLQLVLMSDTMQSLSSMTKQQNEALSAIKKLVDEKI